MTEPRQHSKNGKGKLIAYPGAISLALAVFIHSEAWIIAVVALLGPARAFLVLAIVMTLLTNGIILALETKADLEFIKRMRSRVLSKQEQMTPALKSLIQTSKTLGILASAALVGAIMATFLIHALGYKRPHNYLLATAGSLLFTATWVSIYGGVMLAIKRFLALQ